jgi:hypothetical protein
MSRFTGQPESRSRLVFNVYVCALQETKRGIIHTFLTRYRSGGTPLRPSIGARPGGFAGRRSEGLGPAAALVIPGSTVLASRCPPVGF